MRTNRQVRMVFVFLQTNDLIFWLVDSLSLSLRNEEFFILANQKILWTWKKEFLILSNEKIFTVSVKIKSAKGGENNFFIGQIKETVNEKTANQKIL